MNKEKTIYEKIQSQHGYILAEDVESLIRENRLALCLVRTSQGRFIAPIQNLKHYISMVDSHPTDYVRDVYLYNKN